MTRKELIEKIRGDPAGALDLILGLVNQYCDENTSGKYKGMIGHCFMSDLEEAFDFLGLEPYRITREMFWDLFKDEPSESSDSAT